LTLVVIHDCEKIAEENEVKIPKQSEGSKEINIRAHFRVLLSTVYTVLLILSVEAKEKPPIECTIDSSKIDGFTFCVISNQSSIHQDVERLKIEQTRTQDGVIKSCSVSAIHITNSYFERIPTYIFDNFNKIKWLKISDSKINRIDRDDFKKAADLEFLEIYDSYIGSMSSGAFSQLRNLEEVELNGNKIKKFENPFDDRLEKLNKIMIDGKVL
jgi:hypothetical protein